jgi:hypothetical protein
MEWPETTGHGTLQLVLRRSVGDEEEKFYNIGTWSQPELRRSQSER